MQRYEKKLRYASSWGLKNMLICVLYAFDKCLYRALLFSMCAPSADEENRKVMNILTSRVVAILLYVFCNMRNVCNFVGI